VSSFVQPATLHWPTLADGDITRPESVDRRGENKFNPGAGKGVDLRDRTFRNHIAGEQGRVTPVNLVAADGAVVFGFKCKGRQPASLTWQDMKFGSAVTGSPTGSLSEDHSWDDKHLKINGSINGTVHAECFASYGSMDGVDTGDVGDEDYTLVMQTFYGRGNRDDFIQNDQLKHIVCRDFLIDGCHFFCSVRPGDETLQTDKDIEFHNGLIRLGRNPFFAGQVPGTANPNAQSLYTGPWVDPNDRGLPELSDHQGRGWAHNQLIKTSGGFEGRVIMRDCLILMESKPLGGPTEELVWPRGDYENVVLCYVGETPTTLGTLPSGVAPITDRADGWDLWQTERAKWLLAHGNTDGTGDDFPFLHR
jgi:hypothetical protein